MSTVDCLSLLCHSTGMVVLGKYKNSVSGGESTADKEGEGRFGGVPTDHRQDELNYQIQV